MEEILLVSTVSYIVCR